MANDDDLRQELSFFESIRNQLVAHNLNQFAVIKGDKLFGTYSDFDSAFKAGVEEFGSDSFLVRKVVEKDLAQSNPALAIGLMSVNASTQPRTFYPARHA
eukprot:TRINITY_DN120242_c0_g1_i1.p2 TRINITY_DN120242_c0_g1~~TRINITY_DN120242_c0_g1_i1.p2  ORF type:complete len:100 (-),score=5.29 TRINITY_DN120242_c0_g1_i1:156-455(-)